jgi:hypothetical protein
MNYQGKLMKNWLEGDIVIDKKKARIVLYLAVGILLVLIGLTYK